MLDSIKSDMKNFYNKYWKYVKLMLIFILFLFIDYIVYIPMLIFNIKGSELTGPTVVILSTFKSLVLAFILFLVYRKDLIKEWDIFRANPINNLDAGIKYWFVGLLGMVTSNLLINFFFSTGGAGNETAVQSYISYLPWMMLINAGIIAPFTEEIVFRKAFKDAIKNKWVFVLASGLIFGGMHVITNITNWYDALYIFPYGFLGLAFALSYSETDTVFTSVFLHMLHNSVLVIASIAATLFII